MKRMFLTALTVIVLAVLCVLPVYAADAIEISDAASLRAMAEHPGDSFILTEDIDMAGSEWIPFSFTGELNGNGHAILNLTVSTVGTDTVRSVDGNLKQYNTRSAGLFSSLIGGSVHDLALIDPVIQVECPENCFVGTFAGFVESASIRNCSVKAGRVALVSSTTMAGVGGLAGFGTCTFEDCNVDVTLVHIDRDRDTRCEQFTGGVLACGYGAVNRCTVHIAGYTSCHGYVHDGGLIGMHYQFFDTAAPVLQYSENNTVMGFIRFFEDNWDRRAYCDGLIGENLYGTNRLANNDASGFTRDEVFAYDTELLPHSCTEPQWNVSVTDPGCEEFGFTTRTCALCGYSCTESYTLKRHSPGSWEVITPATLTESGEQVQHCTVCGRELCREVLPPHVVGEWEVVTEPDYGVPGLEQLRCADCGELLDERELPAKVRTRMISLYENSVSLNYKGTGKLYATVLPENADDPGVSWESEDTSVVSVGADGTVYARGIGSTIVTCRANDGGTETQCRVTVSYSFGQKLIRIFLFGFLWY